MKIKHSLAAVVVTAAISITGCSSADPGSPAQVEPSESASADASKDSSPEPTVSPGRVPRVNDNGKRLAAEHDRSQTVVGSGPWKADTGYNIDGALANELGEKAEAFLREHYLRRDRYMRDFYVQPGEMDALREKVAPEMYAKIDDTLASLEADYATHGNDPDKWPRKPSATLQDRLVVVGSLFFNDAPDDGGKGDVVYRTRDRTVFRGTAVNGWEGDLIGAPITYIYVDASHKVGSKGPETFFVWQAWKQVKDEWLIFAAGRNYG